MNYTDLPNELQECFVNAFEEVATIKNKIKALDKQRLSLLYELEDLRDKCKTTGSYMYQKTRARREELEQKTLDINNEIIRLTTREIELKQKPFKIIEAR
jgi:hypothetical protein